ncbi:Glucose--fructose oxidoreductase precursor [Sulfitobacter sp. THAF37]|uniref:Gfo/Idh/MocA family protein n=1 Tax=Sulfitobacter sp. THAF37 TaxID=2587855 RepID=UPI001268B9B2|nr:Gfo/Idh/MocA family oxidoreductase [Sulfitobacter sp. THAF37]QFT59285.1 Glucose--fructose oxidoreductase precursor [Sulfitobacter sp. THAF37]
MTHLRWGVLGASNFARQEMAPAIHAAKGAELAALATSSPAKAEGFRAFAPGLRVHQDYAALLDDSEVDAVYIPLPNHLHVEWAIKALDAGKHVLCEKPLGLKAADFDPVIDARDRTGLLCAEGFMIAHHPQMQRARELLKDGSLGRLRHVSVAFSYFNDDPDNIRNQAQAGGGAMPDIGVYACGVARLLTGAEPVAISHAGIDWDNGVDTKALIDADFGDFTYSAMVSTRMAPRQEVVLHGDKGVLRLTCPFNAGVFDQAELHLETEVGTRTVERFANVNHYVLQVEAFGRSVLQGEDYPCALEFSQGTQRMIDMVYAAGKA